MSKILYVYSLKVVLTSNGSHGKFSLENNGFSNMWNKSTESPFVLNYILYVN